MGKRLMATSPTREGLQKLVNEFYFSTNYIINNDNKLDNINLSTEKLSKINDRVEIKNTLSGWYFYTTY